MKQKSSKIFILNTINALEMRAAGDGLERHVSERRTAGGAARPGLVWFLLPAFSSFKGGCCTFFEETKKLQQLSVSRAVFESAVGAML